MIWRKLVGIKHSKHGLLIESTLYLIKSGTLHTQILFIFDATIAFSHDIPTNDCVTPSIIKEYKTLLKLVKVRR